MYVELCEGLPTAVQRRSMRKAGLDKMVISEKDVARDGYSHLSRDSVQRRAVCAMQQRSKVKWTRGGLGIDQ